MQSRIVWSLLLVALWSAPATTSSPNTASGGTVRLFQVQGTTIGVTTRRLNVRSRPARNGRRLGTTNIGDTVTTVSVTVRNGYIRVETPRGDTGWVLSRGVRLVSTNKAVSAPAAILEKARPMPPNGGIAYLEKPEPLEMQGGACRAVGLGKKGKPAPDPATDLRKNRVDTSVSYQSVSFDQVLALPWSGLPRRRTGWHEQDSLQVVRDEGPPVALIGYLVDVVEEGPESTNCEIDTPALHDWHMWLVPTDSEAANSDRLRAVVVEVTPRVRMSTVAWLFASIRSLVHNRDKVRISGWLMWDPDHPDQVGKTRATTWEIHPVTRIEVERNRAWENLSRQSP